MWSAGTSQLRRPLRGLTEAMPITELPIRQTQARSLVRGERCLLDRPRSLGPPDWRLNMSPRVKARFRMPRGPKTAERSRSSGPRGLMDRELLFP